MLATAHLPYTIRDILAAMTDDGYAALRRAFPDAKFPEERATVATSWWGADFIVDDMDLQILSDAGTPVTLKRVKGLQYNGAPSRVGNAIQAGGQTVNVSVSGVGLLDIRHVTVEEDCCTERLQDLLDKGWRILAVCPPNDSRRPTYILGSSHEIR